VFYSNYSIWNWIRHRNIDLHDYYGLSVPFGVHVYPFLDLEKYRVLGLSDYYYKKVARLCASSGLDVVYTRTFGMARHAIEHDIPVLVESHSPPENDPKKVEMYNQVPASKFLGLVTISEKLAEQYTEFGLPEEKIIVAPDGVDLERFAYEKDQARARREVGLEETGKMVAYVGHLYKDRGIQDLLSAASQLPHVRFIFVGGHQEDIRRLKKTVAMKALNNISIIGFVDNMNVPLYLWAADVLVMPYSRSCPTADWMSPLKLFEYMAARRPIVASRLSALESVLKDGVHALICEPDDEHDLYIKIASLLENESLGRKLAENAAREVSRYTWDKRVNYIASRAGL